MEVTWYGPEARRYRHPIATIEATAREGIAEAWRRADDALANGLSIAGYVAYEAGYAEHPVAAPEPTALPLIALGVFRGPEPPVARENAPVAGAARLGPLVAGVDRARYRSDLAAIAAALHAGDAYQVNYTVPFHFTYDGDAETLAERLRERAGVPYAAFVRHGDRALVSLSPELFFSIDDERIETRPMKGTSRPEGSRALGDPKNRAEHVMIVDLLRNDLHRICADVRVEALMDVERYPTFATMTSRIAGKLPPARGLGEIFGALFPCGSITGAPKRSAMRTIARLERAPRGIAMGAIGFCDAPRRGMWSVAIRTASIDETTHTGELRIGGGIVADSHATSEWAEIAIKRRAFDALATRVGIFETIGVAVDGTSLRADAHLERFERSAFALGIAFDLARVRAAFDAARASCAGRASLVRLALDPDGALVATTRELDSAPAGARACVVDIRLDAYDPTLRHKTTARAAYDAASARANELGCFDGLLLNQRGELADGARTTIFLEDSAGRYATPPLASGALAGILRAELLASGVAYEATLSPHDLHDRHLVLGNAARGLVPACVVSAVARA